MINLPFYFRLVGDVLLCTGFLSYCGPFNQEFRTKLLSSWQIELTKRDIPFTENLNVTGMLTDCSIDCCQDRLCNMPGAQESMTKPNNPPKARNRALKLAENFGTSLLVLVLAMYSMCLA